MRRLQLVGLVVLSVVVFVPQIASSQSSTPSRFVVGEWNFVYWQSMLEKGGWATTDNCTAENAEKTRELGIAISADGKMTANNGLWGCLFSDFHEQPTNLLGARGPEWEFSAKCDEASPQESAKPSATGYKPLKGTIHGAMELRYPSAKGEFAPMLFVWINRPARAGESGLLSLYPTDRYGPYVRCHR